MRNNMRGGHGGGGAQDGMQERGGARDDMRGRGGARDEARAMAFGTRRRAGRDGARAMAKFHYFVRSGR